MIIGRDLDDLQLGRIIKNINNNKTYVIVNNDLCYCYDDHYYSEIIVIEEDIYQNFKGKTIDNNTIDELSTTLNYHNLDYYELIKDKKYDVDVVNYYKLGSEINE